MLAALVSMLMIVADRTGGLELAPQVSLYSGLCIALGTQDDLNVPLVENIHSAAAHAAADDDLCASVSQEVGQEAGLVTGVGNGVLGNDLTVLGIEENEVRSFLHKYCTGLPWRDNRCPQGSCPD